MRALLAAALILAASCATPAFNESEWRSARDACAPESLHAPHEENGRFFNPWLRMEDKGVMDMVRWKLSRAPRFGEEEKNFHPRLATGALERLRGDPMEDAVVWLGHSSFLMRLGGEYWLTDPVLSNDRFMLKREMPAALQAADLATLGARISVIISHNHYDHLDRETLAALPEGTRAFVPLGLAGTVREAGIKDVREMDWWQEIDFGNGAMIACLPAQHWSRTLSQDTNTTLWAGFLVRAGGRSLYFCGDGGMFIGFREIGRRYPGIDYALLPVNPTFPRWLMHYQHMDTDEALDAFRDLGARIMIPMHWGTFRLGDEPAGYAGLQLARRVRERSIDPARVLILGAGEVHLPGGRGER